MESRANGLGWSDEAPIVLIQASASAYQNAVLDVIRAGSETGGVYMTTNRPTAALRQTMHDEDLRPDAWFFVDAVSGMTGILPPAEPGVNYIESPTMLEKMLLRTDQILSRGDDNQVLIVDSLSTMAVYNGSAAVAELVHGMVNRLRVKGRKAAFILVNKQAPPELLENVAPLFDAVIER